MKRLLAWVLLFVSFGMAEAQMTPGNRDMIRIGINGAFFGSGDVLGIAASMEYVHPVTHFLEISPRGMIAQANRFFDSGTFYEYHQITSLGAGVSLRFTPFPEAFHRLKIDLGGLYQRFTKSYGQLESRDMYGTYAGNRVDYYAENLFGLLGSVNLNLIERNRMESGIRLELLTSFYQGSLESESVQGGVYLGIRL